MSTATLTTQDGVVTPSPAAQPSSKRKSVCQEEGFFRKFCVGSLVLAIVSFSWVMMTLLTKNCYSTDFNFRAPFVITYFCSSWSSLLFPFYVIIAYVHSKRHISPKSGIIEGIRVFHSDSFRFKTFFGKSIAFCLIWASYNYLYMRALMSLATHDIIALFSTHQSFVYMLSWIILFEKFVAVRVISTIFAITGIVLYAYDGTGQIFNSNELWGIVLTAGAGAGVAVQKVLFKKYVGDHATIGQICFLLTTLGFGVALLTWPIALILHFTKVEEVQWSSIPWNYLCGAALSALVYQLHVSLVSRATYPVFVGLGVTAAIPLASGYDLLWNGIEFSGMKIAGIVLIIIGQFLLLFPDNWFNNTLNVLSVGRNEDTPPLSPDDGRIKSRFRAITQPPVTPHPVR